MTAPQPSTRRAAMVAFVEAAGWANADIKPLAGDASFRRYERVFLDGKQAVLMDAPPEKEDVRPFITVAKYLESMGMSSPRILAEDVEQGFLLLEDLGDDSYTKLLAGLSGDALTDKERELYLAATDVLISLHTRSLRDGVRLRVPSYDQQPLMTEISLFSDWFLPAVMGGKAAAKPLGDEFKLLWHELLQVHMPDCRVPVLRDYHADNLLWVPSRLGAQRAGLLDFQDALIGHNAYDLVSMLEDARRDVLPQTVDACLAHYLNVTGEDAGEFRGMYALLGAQRNAKIIGIFCRLGLRDGKRHYTQFLPRVWKHFHHDLSHPWLAQIRHWVQANIKPEWQGAISLPETLE